jgi:hypothetical protein
LQISSPHAPFVQACMVKLLCLFSLLLGVYNASELGV